MTAKEWFGVMKQAADYNPEMTSLIEKYGEMLVNEKLTEIELEKKKKMKKPSLTKRILIRIMHGFIGSLAGMLCIYIFGAISFMLPIGFLNSVALTIILSLTMGFGVFAYFEFKSEDVNKSKKQIL